MTVEHRAKWHSVCVLWKKKLQMPRLPNPVWSFATSRVFMDGGRIAQHAGF